MAGPVRPRPISLAVAAGPTGPAGDARCIRVLDPLPVQLVSLAALGFLLTTFVLYALARRFQIDVERHNLVRDARQRRVDYENDLARRREEVAAAKPRGMRLVRPPSAEASTPDTAAQAA